MKYRYIIIVFLLIFAQIASAQDAVNTSVSGTVVDAETGETLPFVQIYFMKSDGKTNSSVGTTSDMDGKFSISNSSGYTLVNFQMMGYKTESITLKKGKSKKDVTVKLKPDVYSLQDVVVKPQKRKREYKRKGNPAVELIKAVIANKNTGNVKNADQYIAKTYSRSSFALDGFNPNYSKPLWKGLEFIDNYVDKDSVSPSLTVSIREDLSNEYYIRKPHKERSLYTRKRIFGVESMLTSASFKANLDAVFTEVDIYDDNMNVLFNKFVSPLSSSLAVAYYQYYIMDTISIDGDSCIDLAFVPVNSESYSFTGHLYIVNDSTFKLKQYSINIPPHLNINFISGFTINHTYQKLANGMWAPDRTTTSAKFFITNRKKTLIARRTKLYTDFDFNAEIDNKVFSPSMAEDALVPADTITIREDLAQWDQLRPEPLSKYESSIVDLLDEIKRTPKFNSLIMLADALSTEFVATTPAIKWGESKWDFGPIYNTISWNVLEGVRLRVGGMTTGNLNHHLFLNTYVAFGCTDLRPKYHATLLYSFNWKEYSAYSPLRHYISATAQYEVEEPGQLFSIVDRDNILNSIPTSKPTMKNYQYVFHARLNYMKEWQLGLVLNLHFDFENNEAAGALKYNRINAYDENGVSAFTTIRDYQCYQGTMELRYTMGGHIPINRQGQESAFRLEKDFPIFSLIHNIGYLDDRKTGGKGFIYNQTEISAEKRFWLSSFGHLDLRLQMGMIWNQVPFTKLYIPPTSTSIFLGLNSFNLMQPMEFIMDEYISLYATYYFKGWILNRIPGINRLKLRGVVSFAGIYGGLTKKNNPFVTDNVGLYKFPDDATYNDGQYVSGYASSPIGTLPYMEITAGFENILKFIRIDYVRRLTYNDYTLPNGMQRKLGGWGRNGVKVTIRFEF